MSSSGTTSQTKTNYARRDLQSAFNWLISQPESIRKQATDPDRLMALYYRSEQLFASSSSQSTAELEIEAPETYASPSSPSISQPSAPVRETARESTREAFREPVREIFRDPTREAGFLNDLKGMTDNFARTSTSTSAQVQVSSQTLTEVTTRTEVTASGLTGKTLEIARQVRDMFNLSSEHEAINLLVALGFEQAKKILKSEDKR